MIKNILILFSFLTLFSCQKNITLDLPSISSNVSIYASISDIDYMSVELTRTVNFYEDNSFPHIQGAKVAIKDSTTNRIFALTEPFIGGQFFTNRIGRVGRTYQLNVNINDSIYTSSSVMPYKVNLDSVTFKSENFFGTEIIMPIIHFQDPKDTSNYYRFIVSNLRSGDVNSFNLEDRLSDGKYMHYTLNYDSSYIHVNDSLRVELRTETRAAYRFFSQIENSAGASSKNNLNVSPANPENNLNNNALGIFDVYTNSSKKVKVSKVSY